MSGVERIHDIPVRPLPEALAEKARIELNEDPKKHKECLRHLKDWIQKQPHLNARTDDQWLMAFLRGTKFNLERCKEKIDLYYSLRSTAPELFALKYTDPRVPDIIKLGVGLVLPKLASPTAPRVIIARGGCYDPNEVHLLEISTLATLLNQICYLEDDNMTVCGIIYILDMQGTKLSHFTQLTPVTLKMAVTLHQDASPTRVKSVHFINTPPFFETFFNFGRMFLNEKIKRRIYVHGKNYQALYEHVPLDILPIEYGGYEYSAKDITDDGKKRFYKYQAWFEEDLKYGTVESKRLGTPNTAERMFGVEGSFKQLEFD